MSGLVVTAKRLSGGELVFDKVLSLTVRDALGSPAVSLRCRVLVDEHTGELGAVTASWEGLTLFDGKVDRQTMTLSEKGRVLQLEGRSRGALLLDNEALPGVLPYAGLAEAFQLFCAPYGFVLASPGDGRGIADFTTQKGQSEWDAFGGFTRRAYGYSPYLRGNQIFVGAPRSVSMLTVGEGGYPFTSLEHERIPYRIVSKVILRDADGVYGSAVYNPDAAFYGVERKRYVIPGEYADNPGPDANRRIRRSMLEKERVTVTLPGITQAEPGQEARVLGEGFAIHNLMVDERSWVFGEGGIVTVLGLVVGRYYE
jgi:hypothetical protein